jgi:hypothetical protein
VTLIHRDGETRYPRQSKSQIAEHLLDEIVSVFSAQLVTSKKKDGNEQ